MGAWFTSGLRLGSAAVTSLGMGTDEMDELADIIKDVLAGTRPAAEEGRAAKAEHVLDEAVAERARARVHELLGAHPLYPELDLELIRSTPVGAAALAES
jgi:glycine hydroxymethyltransferase